MRGQEIAERRMRSAGLAAAPFDDLADVVGWFGAVQAQDYGPAKWSLGQRTTGRCDADVDRALADATVLRTHVLRPTWHFVRPADIRWLLRLTGPRVHAQNAFYYRQLELDERTRGRCADLLAGWLSGGRSLTRAEIGQRLAAAGVPATGLRLGYILMAAELDGLLCSGPLSGRRHTYALLDERMPGAATLDGDAALAELTLRYFTSHGPATAKDFRWWSSLTLADIARGIELVGNRLTAEAVDGVTYWSGPPPPGPTGPVPRVHLLQGYDEYVGGVQESRYVVDLSGDARRIGGDRPAFVNLLLLGTQLAGQWRRRVGRRAVTVEVALYRPFDEARMAALRAAADRHGAFLGLPAEIVLSPVRPG